MKMPFATLADKKSLTVFVSLDVEEDGLFRGVYQQADVSVRNLDSLSRLQPILARGVHPTFFCAHSVMANPWSADILHSFREKWPVEIGAHLHHWNTPPLDVRFKGVEAFSHVHAMDVPTDLMAEKLAVVADMAQTFEPGQPLSFRMGRWDLHGRDWELLAQAGISVDASVRPLHSGTGPDHYLACRDPYRVPTGSGDILELPLTVVPVSGLLAEKLPKIARPSLKHWGALALLPVQHPLWFLKLTTRLHAAAGNSLISLTWHSSEMMPGATPQLPSRSAVDAFLDKINGYLAWLEQSYCVRYATAREAAQLVFANAPVIQSRPGDWTPVNEEQD